MHRKFRVSESSLIEFGGGYYRKEKVAEIQYAIVYVKTTVEYEAN